MFSLCKFCSNKVSSSKNRRHRDSLATVNLEDLFGPLNSSLHYPNTVPLSKITSKSYGLATKGLFDDDDDIKPVAFSSANHIKSRRRPSDIGGTNAKLYASNLAISDSLAPISLSHCIFICFVSAM